MDQSDSWPAHTSESVSWRPARDSVRGKREDRMLREITVSLPPVIASIEFRFSGETLARCERAAASASRMDAAADTSAESLGRFLIRTESVASSRIEKVEASADDFARALSGIRSNESATSMVAASTALTSLVKSADAGHITLDALLAAHFDLMKDDPQDRHYAGVLRPVQNWIGGGSTPRGAIHVPPPPETVPQYMDDLLTYANRDDMPAVAQAAVVHAQFDSVHPFTDGNGRIGRALIGAVLRRRGLTSTTTPPIAAAMVARQNDYFSLVKDYRSGRLTPFIHYLTTATEVASEEAANSLTRVAALPAEWKLKISAREKSAAAQILSLLLDHPVMTADDAEDLTGASSSAIYTAMDTLERSGILRQVTNRKRNKIWAAADVMDELDELSAQIAERAQIELA
ncbi:Fic family protein [Paramicrobacterium chengjingii]|uniref:Fic family protein n=1 Tax=Paramicrobacterium chengjingii TaxID=2769067 RepID=UPI001421FF2D|nr:Fic family protein [Microbacterium chengjingii]